MRPGASAAPRQTRCESHGRSAVRRSLAEMSDAEAAQQSSRWLSGAFSVEPTGIELVTSCLQGAREGGWLRVGFGSKLISGLN